MTFKVLIETMAGHDLNHLQQLEAMPRGRRLPDRAPSLTFNAKRQERLP